jgi:serine/threonine protein phosphatase PrpC
VCGELAVARSVGDVGVKNICPGQVIAVPEYANLALQDNNHFIIMASDGLWDVMSSEEAVTMVHVLLEKTIDLNFVAQNMQDEAIRRGSSDNITICIIGF